MEQFQLKDHLWHAESVSLAKIAEEVGTPCYVYSHKALADRWHAFDNAFGSFPHQVNYAVKANSNLAVLNTLAQLGSGFDIVSGGELARVLQAKGQPEKIIFSGVGKTAEEIKTAIQANVGCLNVESEGELQRINDIAGSLKKKVAIAIRINPDVDPKSHPYISTGLHCNKFGINLSEAPALFQMAAKLPHIQIQGIGFHIGSQMTSLMPILEALDKIIILMDQLQQNGITVSHLNVGGGLGVCYRAEKPPTPKEYVEALLQNIQHKMQNKKITLHIEPGRAIVANAGVLLTRVEYLKMQENHEKHFAIIDAAMNDLIRPALYDAWQDIITVNTKTDPNVPIRTYDIVGPVCESSDFLGRDRSLALETGTLLAVCSAGAYGFSMSSNYNSRPRAAEVMVNGKDFKVIRPREKISDLFSSEKTL